MRSNLDTVLFVGGLDEKVNEKILREIFCAFGDIRNIELPQDPVTKKHRGFAFIQFLEEEDAKHAIFNTDNLELFKKTIHVKYAKTRKGDQYKPLWLDDLYIQEKMKVFDEPSADGQQEHSFEANLEEYEEQVAMIKRLSNGQKKRLEQMFMF